MGRRRVGQGGAAYNSSKPAKGRKEGQKKRMAIGSGHEMRSQQPRRGKVGTRESKKGGRA
jgi:hypothetical protein